MSAGVKVTDNSGKAVYDSTKPRLQVAIDRSPAHLDKVTVTPTQIATNAGNNFFAREVLFEMKHNLGYKPRVLIYFLRSGTNRYDCGKSYFAVGAVDDFLQYEVDETSFRITHQINDYLQVGYTSTASGTTSAKFLIFSNPVNDFTDPAKRGTLS